MINHYQRKWDSADLFKTQICGLNTGGFTNLQPGSHLQSQHASWKSSGGHQETWGHHSWVPDLKGKPLEFNVFEATNWILSWNDTWKQWGWLDYAWFQWKVMEHIGKLGDQNGVRQNFTNNRDVFSTQTWETSRFASAIATIASSGFGIFWNACTEIEAMWRTNMIVDHLAWG